MLAYEVLDLGERYAAHAVQLCRAVVVAGELTAEVTCHEAEARVRARGQSRATEDGAGLQEVGAGDGVVVEGVGVGVGRHGPGRLAPVRDLPRIAAELRDVVAHPLKRGPLIQHAQVLVRQPLCVRETEDVDPVVDGDDDVRL